MDEYRDRLSFLERQLGPSFESLVVVIAPGGSRANDDAEWQDALVVVERGQIELETASGGRQCFGRGDVLCLAGLPLRAMHNHGRKPAILVAVSRRHGPTD